MTTHHSWEEMKEERGKNYNFTHNSREQKNSMQKNCRDFQHFFINISIEVFNSSTLEIRYLIIDETNMHISL
jgi:hypothetical protein